MNGLNENEKKKLKQFLQEVGNKFEEIINKMIEDNPNQDPAYLGLFISYAFSKEIKGLQKPDLDNIGLTEEQLDSLIENMSREVLTKFMNESNYNPPPPQKDEIDLELSRQIAEYKQSGGRNKNLIRTLESLKSEPKNKGCSLVLATLLFLVGFVIVLFI